MTAEQIRERLQRVEAELNGGPLLIRAGLEAGQAIVAQIASRIRQKGEDEQGAPFTPYSTNQIPAWFYIGKSRNSGADSAVKQKAKRRETISYKEFRQLNGLKTERKNYEFTGELFRDFKVLNVTSSGTVLTIEYGGATKQAADKLEWAKDDEGKSIILASKQEIEIAKTIIQNRINTIING
jgi:hypothetical protein